MDYAQQQARDGNIAISTSEALQIAQHVANELTMGDMPSVIDIDDGEGGVGSFSDEPEGTL